jgi:hypothetical protein
MDRRLMRSCVFIARAASERRPKRLIDSQG